MLILDEPTSGVDPAARDMFWAYLIKLSREDKITIFVTTHFMNEAARCDRISFMHRGRVLAVGTPETLRLEKKVATLEEAFICYLEEQTDNITAPPTEKAEKSAVEKTLGFFTALWESSCSKSYGLAACFCIKIPSRFVSNQSTNSNILLDACEPNSVKV